MARRRTGGRPTRRASPRETRRQILLFVEGRRTETGYFKHHYRRNNDRVIVSIDDFHKGPVELVERAIALKRREQYEERHGRGKAPEEIWCVFDVDDHPKRDEAIRRAAQHGIEVAVSNPCLELWFILHFADQTAHIDRRAAIRRAEALLGCSKTLTDEALQQLTARHDEAVKRASALDRKHALDGSPPRSNPSSDVWRLIERMRDERRCPPPRHRDT